MKNFEKEYFELMDRDWDELEARASRSDQVTMEYEKLGQSIREEINRLEYRIKELKAVLANIQHLNRLESAIADAICDKISNGHIINDREAEDLEEDTVTLERAPEDPITPYEYD